MSTDVALQHTEKHSTRLRGTVHQDIDLNALTCSYRRFNAGAACTRACEPCNEIWWWGRAAHLSLEVSDNFRLGLILSCFAGRCANVASQLTAKLGEHAPLCHCSALFTNEPSGQAHGNGRHVTTHAAAQVYIYRSVWGWSACLLREACMRSSSTNRCSAQLLVSMLVMARVPNDKFDS